MIPYYPAVYIGPNGEQFPVGYHPPPMALPYEQHQQQQHASPQNSRQYRPTAHQHQHQHHPQHHPRAQQHALHQHSQQQHSQHFQGHQNGPFPIHGPTSTPLSFVGTTIKPTSFSGQSTLESISTPNMHQLKSSASLGSIGSSSSGSSGDKGDSEGGDTFNSHEDSSSTNLSPAVSLPALRAPAPDYPSPAQPSAKTSFPSSLTAAACTGSQQTQTSHHSNPPSSSASSAMGTISPAAVADTGTQGNAAVSDTGKASAHMTPATAGGGSGNENYPSTTDPAANTYETAAVQGQQAEEEVVGERDGLQEQPKQQEAVSPPSSSQHQHQQQQQHLQQPFGQYPSPYSAPHSVGPHSGSHQSPYPQPSHRSAPASPYYPSRQNPNHSKPLSGQQGQGPGIHGAMALPQGPAPSQQAYGAPPPFFGPTVPPMPPSPGSRRTAVYPGQAPVPPGSHPFSMPTGGRPGQQFHSPSGYKQPFTNQGYPQDFQHSGYYATPEGWHQIPTPALQKKPKELDKAMWVGNVLNDTTLAELQAIFEAEPTEAEGDIQHDIPEVKIIYLN
ncbi:hypothetical protein BC939DRAFT_115557 [Gamsiella multidivaricata]|uniref:uncharacterized protein n=1 Tax=Gamsiella multidivaricata TaxID=101098 RepID=UPI0022201285|nr:uncharacterized protein BC939DRAFT_115557 [Gamsiella multidivaricata]KAI7826152.1 hypothetical protein BC939DRAFT_115557 [Gamsiella multidivaricata]